jgi:hypothetical protein
MSHNDVWNYSSQTVAEMVANAPSDVMVIGDSRLQLEPANGMYERMTQLVRDTGAGMAYSDSVGHPRIEYQPGSIRDNFDCGAVLAISVPAAREAMKAADSAPQYQWGGLYDLRLRLSEIRPIIRIPEMLYDSFIEEDRPESEAQFDYVDPRNRNYQIEMEQIATRHLQRIGAALSPTFRKAERSTDSFAVEATIVIPVRNRELTIFEAVWSALSQKAEFEFNVIVVDNHSTDRTSEILRAIEDPRLIHIIPERTDLGIGGCWNLAVQSPACGRYVVQLDSDDLYQSDTSLARMVEELRRGPFAMVVGAYSMVNFDLQPLPPGLIDHREWTDDNGPNNALRINGLGAPRAFDTAILRKIWFPNVSYGEDYAVGLRISREYAIGRIYESVYLCRRWGGNSDSALPIETANRYDSYKDWLRTNEIRARQRR